MSREASVALWRKKASAYEEGEDYEEEEEEVASTALEEQTKD